MCPLFSPPVDEVEKLAFRALPVITRTGDIAMVTRKNGLRRQEFVLQGTNCSDRAFSTACPRRDTSSF